MSEQEFNKWKNKFRLWKILHYEVKLEDAELYHCDACIHTFFSCNKLFKRCPDKRLCYIKDNGGDRIEEIEAFMPFEDEDAEIVCCIEWIKNV